MRPTRIRNRGVNEVYRWGVNHVYRGVNGLDRGVNEVYRWGVNHVYRGVNGLDRGVNGLDRGVNKVDRLAHGDRMPWGPCAYVKLFFDKKCVGPKLVWPRKRGKKGDGAQIGMAQKRGEKKAWGPFQEIFL